MRKLSFLVLIIPLLFISSIQSVSASRTTSVELLRLTSGFYREDWPAIYKDKILWVAEGIIYIYDVKDKTTYPFFEGEQPLSNFYGLTGYDGRYLVYSQYNGVFYDVSAYDTLKQKEIQITNGSISHNVTDYDNKTVLYIDGGACGTLYAYNITNGKTTHVTDEACGSAKISKDVVVWTYGNNIYGYDLKKDGIFQITNNGGHPDIYKDNIVWLSVEEGFTKVHLKNLNNGESKILHQTPEYGITYPAISNRYVIWGKTTSQHVAGVEGIDMITGEVFEIQEQGSHQNGVIAPQLEGNIAAWMAWRTGNGDIYGADFSK